MGQPFWGGGQALWALLVPRETTKRLLTPLRSPAAAFIPVGCTGQIKGPQESPRSRLRRRLSPEWGSGGQTPRPSLAGTPRAPQQQPQCLQGLPLPCAVPVPAAPGEPLLPGDTGPLLGTPPRGRAPLPEQPTQRVPSPGGWPSPPPHPPSCRGLFLAPWDTRRVPVPATAFSAILGHFGANLVRARGRCRGKGYFRNCKRRHKLSCLQRERQECEVKR